MDIYELFGGLLLIYMTISTVRSEVVNPKELFVRVIDGENGNKGRLEIYDTKELKWYPVCRTTFTDANANVVCRMLGYTNVSGRAIKVDGSGSIWKRHLECKGNETFLSQCADAGVNVGSICEYVGVDCSNSGSPEGFFIIGGYGYIYRMDDSTLAYIQIPKNNTRIMIGLSFDFETKSLFWSDSNTIRKLEVASGEMQTLFSSEDLNIISCWGLALDSSKRLLFYIDRSRGFVGRIDLENPNDRVFIIKSAKTAQHLVIDPDRGKIYWVEQYNRLLKEADYNGTNQREVVSNDVLKEHWTRFTLDDSYVYIVSYLATAILVHGRYDNSSYSINISMYSLYWSITQWNDYLFLTSARQSQVIRIHKYGYSVELFGPTMRRYSSLSNIMHYPSNQAKQIFVRVFNGSSDSGTVQVYDTKSTTWYSICSDNWGYREATVVCRMLGYPNSQGKTIDTEGIGKGWDRNVVCREDAKSLNFCKFKSSSKTSCTYAGVDCSTSGKSDGFFLMTTNEHVYRMDDITHAYIKLPISATFAYGLAYDYVDDFIFWSDGKDFYYAKLTSKNKSLFVRGPSGITNPDIAVDSVNRKLFYSDKGHDDIWMVNMDQSRTSKKILDNANEVTSIVVDTKERLIFWFEKEKKLMQASYDGSNVRTLYSFSLSRTRVSFTLDDNYFYITTWYYDKILIYNREENNTNEIKLSSGWPLSITASEDRLYLTDFKENRLLTMRRDGSDQKFMDPPVDFARRIIHYRYEQVDNTSTTASPFEATNPVTMDSTSSLHTTSTTASPFETTNPVTMDSTSSLPTTAMYTTQDSIVETTTTEPVMPSTVLTDEITTSIGTVTAKTTSESSSTTVTSVGDVSAINTETIAIAAGVGVVTLISGVVIGVLMYRRCSSNSPPGKELYMTPLSKSLVGRDNAAYDELKPANTAHADVENDGYVEPLYTVIEPENEKQSTPAVTNNSTLPDGEGTDPHIYLELNPEPSSNTKSDDFEGHAHVF